MSERPDGSICLYLIEEGPWPDDCSDKLKLVQNRLFDTVEAIAERKLDERFIKWLGFAESVGLCADDITEIRKLNAAGLSYLPHSGSVLAELADDVASYVTSKGALQFGQ